MSKQRGFKSYGELTLNDVLKMCEETMGEWNGDESGKLEDRTNAAIELTQVMNKAIDLIIALKEEL
jgi:hypothetical protein